jgi:hypothetical protein
MVADMDPIPVGSVGVSFDRSMARGLSQASAEVVFHPRLNSVSLEFRHEFVTFRQFWDEAARRRFAAALERYNADFEARSLVTRHRRSRAAYGSADVRLEWQMARFTTNRVAYPVVELGYRFREVGAEGRFESRPFFAILMRSATSPGAGNDEVDSRPLYMYFTRAQAAELAAMFDQARLMEYVESAPAGAMRPDPAADEYDATSASGAASGIDAASASAEE